MSMIWQHSMSAKRLRYKQHLVNQANEKGIKLKKASPFLKTEELEAALAEHLAKVEA